MIAYLLTLFSSFVATFLIIRYKHLHEEYSSDSDFLGPQKFHTDLVPRIGGISIAIGLLAGIIFQIKNTSYPAMEITFLICAIPAFAIGLSEDLTKKITVRARLIVTALGAILFVQLMPAEITHLDIPILDMIFLAPGVGIILTVVAITGLANAFNIIDGFNGLASMTGIMILLSIAYVSIAVYDPLITHLSLILVASIFGVFFWNYPRGLIFLGDGGAYLIGFWVSSLSVLLIYRHQEISPWFAMLINGYPITETLYSIYRRKIHQGKSPGQPDGMHFHTLVYRRVLKNKSENKNGNSSSQRNSKVAPLIGIFIMPIIFIAVIFYESSLVLSISFILFLIIYIIIYTRLVRFKFQRLNIYS